MIKSKLLDIVQSSEFINIDRNDINRFFETVNHIDMVTSSGMTEDISTLFRDSIYSIQEKNKQKSISRILFIIRLAKSNNFLIDNVKGIYDIIEHLENETEITWGISTCNYMQEQQVELVLVAGF